MNRLYALLFIFIITISTIYSEENGSSSMKQEKVIFEKSKTKAKKILYEPDSISGLWDITRDVDVKYFNSNKTYCLVIDKNEKSGVVIFFNEWNGDILDKKEVSIKRIDTGTYEMRYNNKKRIFKISYDEYDGQMYIYYENSTPYDENKGISYDGSLFSRDYSETSQKKLFQMYIDNNELGDVGP